MSDFVCEPLGNQHDRTLFDCGVSMGAICVLRGAVRLKKWSM